MGAWGVLAPCDLDGQKRTCFEYGYRRALPAVRLGHMVKGQISHTDFEHVNCKSPDFIAIASCIEGTFSYLCLVSTNILFYPKGMKESLFRRLMMEKMTIPAESVSYALPIYSSMAPSWRQALPLLLYSFEFRECVAWACHYFYIRK